MSASHFSATISPGSSRPTGRERHRAHHRTYLQTLLEALLPHITATNQPKRVACGAPDYVISTATRSGPATIGYVEAKDIGVPLNETLKTDQLKRYRRALKISCRPTTSNFAGFSRANIT